VIGAELEAAVLQVEGVEYLEDLKWADGRRPEIRNPPGIEIEPDEAIELESVSVVANVPADRVPEPGQGPQPEPPGKILVPIPRRQDEC